jgi:hypothetical protein
MIITFCRDEITKVEIGKVAIGEISLSSENRLKAWISSHPWKLKFEPGFEKGKYRDRAVTIVTLERL